MDYIGARFVLGQTRQGGYALWHRTSGGLPTERFPRSPHGWAESWAAYVRRNRSPFAVPSLILGLIGLFIVFIPWMWALAVLPSALALVFGVLGVSGTGTPGTGRAEAIMGLVLGSLTFPVALRLAFMSLGSIHP